MPINLICPQCGFENKTAGVFCSRCGGRMGAPQVKETKEPIRIFHILGVLLRYVIILAIVIGIGLVFWPQSIPDLMPDRAHAERFQQTIKKLTEAAKQKTPMVQVIADTDINNYIAWRVADSASAQDGSGVVMDLKGLYVTTTPRDIRVVALGALGPIKLSYEARGRPVVGRGRFALDVRETKIGHFALPGPASGFVLGRIEGIVGGLTDERAALDGIAAAELGEGKVRVTIGR